MDTGRMEEKQSKTVCTHTWVAHWAARSRGHVGRVWAQRWLPSLDPVVARPCKKSMSHSLNLDCKACVRTQPAQEWVPGVRECSMVLLCVKQVHVIRASTHPEARCKGPCY